MLKKTQGSQLNDANWFFSQGVSMTKQHGDQVRPEITYNKEVSYILSEPCGAYSGWTKPPAGFKPPTADVNALKQ